MPNPRPVTGHLFVQRPSSDFVDPALREAGGVTNSALRGALAKRTADQLITLGDQGFGEPELVSDLSKPFEGVDSGHIVAKHPAPVPPLQRTTQEPVCRG